MARNWKTPMQWDNEGSEPSSTLKQSGFAGGYKPPATVFNYFFNRTKQCIEELQTVADGAVGKSLAGQSVQPTNGTTVTAGTGAEVFNDTRDRTFYNGLAYTGNIASGNYSRAEGSCTTASGTCSHAQGYQTIARGAYSHAEGEETYAIGIGSHAGGFNTIAQDYQFVTGKYNTGTDGCSYADSQATNETIFIVGNGTETATSNAFRITADGQCRGTKAFIGSGADFAEYFEWLDGNPNNEDRRGKFVTLDGEKIKLANDGDYILGIVSASGAFIGNSQSEDWQGKYLKDVYGDWLTQEVTVPEKTDENGKVIPAHTSVQYVVNPDFDPETEYISRELRKEWSPVGMLGQLTLVDDGTCSVNGYCKPSANGIGTAADSGYRVLRRIDNTHIKVLVK